MFEDLYEYKLCMLYNKKQFLVLKSGEGIIIRPKGLREVVVKGEKAERIMYLYSQLKQLVNDAWQELESAEEKSLTELIEENRSNLVTTSEKYLELIGERVRNYRLVGILLPSKRKNKIKIKWIFGVPWPIKKPEVYDDEDWDFFKRISKEEAEQIIKKFKGER